MIEMKVALIQRGELPDVLRGIGNPKHDALEVREGRLSVRLRNTDVGVGYFESSPSILPSFVVIPNSDPREFFAWINTYCSFASPITQWCRVVTEDDLARVQSLRIVPRFDGSIAAWAGAVVGEALLHVGTVKELPHLPLIALQACSSFVVARTYGLWGTSHQVSTALERFQSAQNLLGNTGRGPRLSDCHNIWAVLESLSTEPSLSPYTMNHELELILRSCKEIQEVGFVSESTLSEVLSELSWPTELVDFEKAGAERRVTLFDQASARLFQLRSELPDTKTLAEFTVAYFAARIGGSPSAHLSLLEKLVNNHPIVAMWYGAVSGLYRPDLWANEFGGLGRLALKELSFPLHFDDPPRCDIAFDELTAVVEPKQGSNSLSFRGATRRALNVEVALGINGLIRISSLPDQDSVGIRTNEQIQELAEVLRHLQAATDSAARLNRSLGTPVPDRQTKKRSHRKKKATRSKRKPKNKSGSDDDPQLSF